MTTRSKESPIIISGWLKKLKRRSRLFLPDWNARWVTVQNDRIFWRHSKHIEVAGLIELEHVTSVYRLNVLGNTHDKRHIFVIRSRKRTLCLMTETESECEKWVRAIQMQLDLRRGGTSSGPPGVKNRRKSNGGGDRFTVRFYSFDF